MSESDSSRGTVRSRQRSNASSGMRGRSRSSSGSSSDSRYSYKRKSYKHKRSKVHRSRSRDRSGKSRSRHHAKTSDSSHSLRSRSSSKGHSRRSSRDRSRSRDRRSRSRDRRSRSRDRRSRSRDKRSTGRTRSRSRSRDRSRRRSRSKERSKCRSSSSSSSPEIVRQEPSTEEQLRAKLQRAIRAAQSADDQLRQQGLLSGTTSRKEEVYREPAPVYQGSVLDEINDSSFVQKRFTSSKSAGRQTSDTTTVIDLTVDTVPQIVQQIPQAAEDPESIFHTSLNMDPQIKLDKWVKKLFHLRQKAINGEPLA